jgi:5-methylcytosine-specific restriction protein A
MPNKASKLCLWPRCGRLTSGAYCEEHTREKRKQQEANTDRSSKPLYNSARWKAMRLAQLSREPLCAECLKVGRLTAATIVDHIVPHKCNANLFFDSSNHQSLCKHHHDIKTLSEGAFGIPQGG